MKCRNCGTENPEQANYCNECGAKLKPAISLKKDELPPAFMDRTYIRDNGQSVSAPVSTPEPVAEPSVPPATPEPSPPPADTPVFSPSSAPNHTFSADLPHNAFSNPPTGRNPAVPEILSSLRPAWGDEDDDPQEPWYENTWVCIAALLLFFPLGALLLWKFHKDWGRTVNTVITCSFGAVFLAIATSWFLLYIDSTKIRPEQLQILCEPHALNLDESEYIDFKITPSDALYDDTYFLSTEDDVLLVEQFIDDEILRGKITAKHAGTTYIYLYDNGKISNGVEISVIDTTEYQIKAEQFSKKIKDIGTVTLDKAPQINNLLKEYNSLPGHIKELIQNANVLMKANRTLEGLQKEEAERLDQMVKDAEDTIDEIGEVTLEKQDLIEETRKQVDAIPLEKRKAVTNHEKLKEAESLIKKLQLKQDILEQSEPVTSAFYNQYLRDPDTYQGRFTTFQGKVFQISQKTKNANFYLVRLYDESGETDMVFYFAYALQNQPRILEGDIVTIYGYYNGVVQYFTSETTTASVPQVSVKILETS
ncbi:zinc-ribbon domain-containing protein [Clostridium sp. D33t1_170424_F3]|uniref:zinc-ribbon domain-containing protein n=1 Tax=Clostridium sp. D33t1_170424_F3 TaxID=2787099 RepID=UPI0018AC1F36|nr:zinc-ribbon domain-containing protein [Clostridium sp. D33t1_170424_F3]